MATLRKKTPNKAERSLQRLKPGHSQADTAGLKPGPPKPSRGSSVRTKNARTGGSRGLSDAPAHVGHAGDGRGVAVVTGGAGSMGTTICQTLAREGMRIVVGYNRSAEKAKSLAASLPGDGHVALPAPVT